MRNKSLFGLIALALLSSSCNYLQTDKFERTGVRRLNNLVLELARFSGRRGENQIKFTNPRNGWVYFRSGGDLKTFELRNSQGDVKRFELVKSECMRWLPVGEYNVYCKTKGDHIEFLIRSIPELILECHFWKKDGNQNLNYMFSKKEKHGADGMYLLYWDYINKKLLRNYNTVFGVATKELNESGRKGIMRTGLRKKNEKGLLTSWEPGFAPPWSGVIVDEFVPPVKRVTSKDEEQGGYTQGMGFKPYVFSAIKKLHEKYGAGGNVFYGYLGLPSSPDAIDNTRPLMTLLAELKYKWVWEAYLWPGNSIEKRLVGRMETFEKLYPECEKNAVVCLCTMEFWDNAPNFDMKVWLDLQMNAIANNKAFKDVYGITSWSTKYTRPELVLWFSSLLRHYCIEGNKTLLSKKYGYVLNPGHLNNSDFSKGLKGWTVVPAAAGSVSIRPVGEFSFKKGYFPQYKQQLVMKKVKGASNRIEKRIEKLKPGNKYLLFLQVGSPDVVDKLVDYNAKVAVEGVEIIHREKRIIRSKLNNKICRNAIEVVFKAKSNNAMLIIEDGHPKPSTPRVKEIYIDGIKVLPYYSQP